MLKKQKIILFLAIGISVSFFAVKAYGCSWTAITTCDTRVSACLPGQAWNPAYWYWSDDCGILWCANHPLGWPIGTCAWITGWICNSSGIAVPSSWSYDHNFGGGCPGDAPQPTCATNGVCSTPNHTWNLCSKPNSLLCNAGTPSIVNGTGIPDWWWTCAGSGGGSTVNCWSTLNTCGDGNVACGEQCDLGIGNGLWPSTCSTSCTINTCAPNCNDSDSHCQGTTYTGNCGQNCNGTLPDSCPVWIGNCDKVCGGGIETRSCSCPTRTETRACNSQPCPPGYREVTPW